MGHYLKSGTPFLYDDTSNDIVGVRDADGTETLFPTRAETLSLRASGIGRPRGLSSRQRHWSPAPFPAGTTGVTIQNQIPIPSGGVNGFRVIHENGTTTASTLNTGKVAIGTVEGANGSALTWTSLAWSGASSVALPVAVGTAPQSVITPILSDRVDLPASSGYLFVRSYFSGSGCALNPAAGELTNFATATGLTYKSGFSSGVIADNVGITMSAGQLVVPSGVVWYHDRPSLTIAAIGGSTLRGQGSTANAVGMVYRACSLLTNASRFASPYIAAQSGQNSTTTASQLPALIPTVLPDVVVMLPGSGNDSDLTSTGFAAMRARLAANIDLCRRNNVIPVVCTLMPSSALTAPQETLRLAQNAIVTSLAASGLCVLADIATVAENPSNRATLLPAFDQGDGTHLNDLGHAATASVLAAAIANITG